ncbi:MAG: PRC-barrel domain-containing protein [Archaeoglobaceae archaeon]|nr:PRC-barrel domain-containing protein [Archaeoglobaceae archaeon]MCX8152347.1 PRC-barrel domain-containing protein [Archaeoglobaceae archaeon]MDW8013625.1 PRC-barrel domain-containing protein [Archaeoglobaceae archaeon]
MMGEISNFFGMKVFTDDGVYVGRVAEVIIDTDTKVIRGLALVEYNKAVVNSNAKGVIIPYRIVKAVGDIVIVKNVFKSKKVEQEQQDQQGQ